VVGGRECRHLGECTPSLSQVSSSASPQHLAVGQPTPPPTHPGTKCGVQAQASGARGGQHQYVSSMRSAQPVVEAEPAQRTASMRLSEVVRNAMLSQQAA
jgi:hypothetical protein